MQTTARGSGPQALAGRGSAPIFAKRFKHNAGLRRCGMMGMFPARRIVLDRASSVFQAILQASPSATPLSSPAVDVLQFAGRYTIGRTWRNNEHVRATQDFQRRGIWAARMLHPRRPYASLGSHGLGISPVRPFTSHSRRSSFRVMAHFDFRIFPAISEKIGAATSPP